MSRRLSCRNERQTSQLTFARSVAVVRFVSGHALAAAGQVEPLSVAVTQVLGRLLNGGVAHADAVLRHDRRLVESRRSVRERRKVHRHSLAHDVVDPNGKQRRAATFVEERKVDSLLRDGDVARLHVLHDIGVVDESAVGGDDVLVAIRVRVPSRIRGVCDVRFALVVEQLERLLALLEKPRLREFCAATHRERYLDVETLRLAARNERGP